MTDNFATATEQCLCRTHRQSYGSLPALFCIFWRADRFFPLTGNGLGTALPTPFHRLLHLWHVIQRTHRVPVRGEISWLVELAFDSDYWLCTFTAYIQSTLSGRHKTVIAENDVLRFESPIDRSCWAKVSRVLRIRTTVSVSHSGRIRRLETWLFRKSFLFYTGRPHTVRTHMANCLSLHFYFN